MGDDYDRFWGEGLTIDTTDFNLTPTIRTEPTPSIDPTKVTLPDPFVVLITGAGKGIGKQIAFSYAKAHASAIILCTRTASDLGPVAEEISKLSPATKCITTACDVASEESVKALVPLVTKTFGRLDVLINNAGVINSSSRKIGAHAPSDFRAVFDINVVGTFQVTHHFLPLLLESKDGAKTVVNISSAAAFFSRGPCAYAMSKVAMNKFSELLAGQYSKEGLLAFSVHPGQIRTETIEDKDVPKEMLGMLNDSPELPGAFCVWLTKERRDWLNGRYLSAEWDVGELEAKKEDIVNQNLLTVKLKL